LASFAVYWGIGSNGIVFYTTLNQ